MKQENQQLAAKDLLEKIKYPLIHFIDHLRRENPESKLGDFTINMLTALESIEWGVANFFPLGAQCELRQDNYRLSMPANKYVLDFIGIEKDLIKSLAEIKDEDFPSPDKDNTLASFKLLQESKKILEIPITSKNSLYYGICAYGETPKTSPILTTFFHAKNFPCFQSFQFQYQLAYKDSLADYCRRISHSIFNYQTKKIMDDFINNQEINSFREILTYTFRHPNSLSTAILKKNFKIDLKQILSILNAITPLNRDLQTIIVSYTCPI